LLVHRRGPVLEGRDSPFRANLVATAAQQERDSEPGEGRMAQPPLLPGDAVGRDLTCGLGLHGLTNPRHAQVRRC